MNKKNREWRRNWRKEFREASGRKSWSSNEDSEESQYTPEELEAHPELYRKITKTKRKKLWEKRRTHFEKQHHYRTIKMVKEFNKPIYTHLIEGLSIVLGILFVAFGVIGGISIFGITENNTWPIYSATRFFGWEGNAITGFVLIIIGFVILWSIPFYLFNNTQKGDSYLIIGTGLGILFGAIYVFIILADILTAAVDALSNQSQFLIETFFYYPILLSLLSIPVFRILAIRHIVFAPTEVDEKEIIGEQEFEEPDWDSIKSFDDFRKEFRKMWKIRTEYYRKRRHTHRKKKGKRNKKW